MQIRRSPFRQNLIFTLFFSLGLLGSSELQAQWPEVLSAAWSDSFKEWQVYDQGEEPIGFLKLRNTMGADWTDWMYQIGEESGLIKTKFRDDLNVWELRGGNLVYTARTQWPNDPLTWLISGEGVKITLKSKYTNILEEWTATESNCGDFLMYTFNEGDPRDWETRETLDSDKFHLKVFLMFLVVINSTPRI